MLEALGQFERLEMVETFELFGVFFIGGKVSLV
jgi:hypothetical protein